MEKWQKIEIVINRLLNNIFRILSALFSKITPAKFKKCSTESAAARKKTQFAQKLIALQTTLTNWSLKRRKQISNISSNTQGYILSIVLKARSIKASSFKPQGLTLLFGSIFGPLFLKVRKWFLALRPRTIALTTSSVAIFALASIQIYQNSQKIAEDNGIVEAQNLVEDLEKAGALSRRPASHGKVRQILTVTSVNMPVYLGSPKDLSSVLLDFTVITTNRTVKNFLNENELLIRDKLTNSIHPILPEFTLTIEGKEIIKDKIRRDLNELIHELDKSGNYQDLISDDMVAIESVHVDALLAN